MNNEIEKQPDQRDKASYEKRYAFGQKSCYPSTRIFAPAQNNRKWYPFEAKKSIFYQPDEISPDVDMTKT